MSAADKPQTERVSVSSLVGAQGNGNSGEPAISADRRFVAFVSGASNLVDADTNASRDVFVYDRTTHTTERVSVSSTGAEADGASMDPAISANGQFVAFVSEASNLVDADTNASRDVFVYNRATHKTRRVSVSSTGAQADEEGISPSISANGRFVAFQSLATNLVSGDTNREEDVFVHDRVTHRTQRVSVSSAGGEGNAWSIRPAISANGRFVAFQSHATNLVSGDSNRKSDVFVRDRATHQTRLVSVSSNGKQSNRTSGYASISADGRYVAFQTFATNLVRADTNRQQDVFVYDRATHQTRRVSVSSNGAQANRSSRSPSISGTGRFIAFQSSATNLVRADTNRQQDVFVYDRAMHKTRRVSVNSAREEGNEWSIGPTTSANGRFVAFASKASNLVNTDTNGAMDVFVRGPLR